MIVVTSAAESHNLTTTERVKQHLKVTSAADNDWLSFLITRASAAIERLTYRRFAKESVTETVGGSGRVELVLSRVPIISVSEARFDGTAVTLSDIIVSNKYAGLIFYQSGFTRTSINIRPLISSVPTGEAALDWEVDYVGGYWLPSFSGSPGASDILLPGDLEQLCIDLVSSWYKGSDRDPNIKSERIGDYSATYGEGQVPERIVRDLQRDWRRNASLL